MMVSGEQAALICRHHVFDIDVRIFASMLLHQLERLLNQVTNVVSILLRVVNGITNVQITMPQQVHNRQDLAIVGHKRLSNSI